MFSVAKDWNPKQKRLASLLAEPSKIQQAIIYCLALHNEVHDLNETSDHKTVYQELVQSVDPAAARRIFSGVFGSLAWNVWHISRIEDAVANILIADDKPVFNPAWKKKIKSPFPDSGNAFTPGQMREFGDVIDWSELLDYRKAVGIKTRKIISGLGAADLKRKSSLIQLKNLRESEIVTEDNASVWLLDFWAKKTVSGLLKMPITRHQIVHINSALKIKALLAGENRKRKS